MGLLVEGSQAAVVTAGRDLDWVVVQPVTSIVTADPISAGDEGVPTLDAVRCMVAVVGTFTSCSYSVWLKYAAPTGPAATANGQWCNAGDLTVAGLITENDVRAINVAGADRVYIQITAIAGGNATAYVGRAIVTSA